MHVVAAEVDDIEGVEDAHEHRGHHQQHATPIPGGPPGPGGDRHQHQTEDEREPQQVGIDQVECVGGSL